MALFLFFILLLNVVVIALIYYCLTNIEKKERIIFIGVGIAICYMLTSFVYWLSTKNIEIQEVSETGKNLITFLFVPINGILVLPLIAKSYNKYKIGALASDKLRNRVIVLVVLLLIVLFLECSYFKDIQEGVIDLIKSNNINEVESVNIIANDVITNEMYINENIDDTSNIVDDIVNNLN